MQPADVDPSLRTGEPVPQRLDDGFSAPAAPAPSTAAPPAGPALGAKSLF